MLASPRLCFLPTSPGSSYFRALRLWTQAADSGGLPCSWAPEHSKLIGPVLGRLPLMLLEG